MNQSNYRISLDINGISSPVTLSLKKGETGRKIHITLIEYGKPYQISENCYAHLFLSKDNGAKLEHGCIIQDNTIQYVLEKGTTSSTGIIKCEVMLRDADGDTIVSSTFMIEVFDTVISENDVEESNEFTSLSDLITTVNTKLDNGDFKPTIEVGEVMSCEPYDEAKVVNVGTNKAARFDFTIPRGFQGIQGEKGDKGDVATIQVGAVTTGEPNTEAKVENTGTSGNAVLNFTIPKGDKGDKGEKGDKGDRGTKITVDGVEQETWEANSKLDKNTNKTQYHQIYMKENNGTNVMANIGHYNQNNSVPRYALASLETVGEFDYGATISVSNPQQPYQAANKKYVDDGLSGKVDKLENTTSSEYMYVEKNGNTELLASNSLPRAYTVVKFAPKTSGDTLNEEFYSGTVIVGTPEKPYQATNKKYVDGEIAKIKSSDDTPAITMLCGVVIFKSNTNPNPNDYTTLSLNNLTGVTKIDWGDGNVTENADNNVVEFSHTYSYEHDSGTIDYYTVKIYGCTNIGFNAFISNYIVDIHISDGVTIGEYGLRWMRFLKTVRLPNDLLAIPTGCFEYDQNLTRVVIPNSVTSIGNSAFYQSRVRCLIIGNSVRSIGSNLFYSSYTDEYGCDLLILDDISGIRISFDELADYSTDYMPSIGDNAVGSIKCIIVPAHAFEKYSTSTDYSWYKHAKYITTWEKIALASLK